MGYVPRDHSKIGHEGNHTPFTVGTTPAAYDWTTIVAKGRPWIPQNFRAGLFLLHYLYIPTQKRYCVFELYMILILITSTFWL